jgi:hypothetical protein
MSKLRLEVEFTTNEYFNNPSYVELEFTEADINKLKHLHKAAEKESVKIEWDFEQFTCFESDGTEENTEFKGGYAAIKISPEGSLHFYCQVYRDSATQLETKSFSIEEVEAAR